MNQNCKVCGEPAAGFHFGAFTCEGCKSFFGRTYKNLTSLNDCKNNGRCTINKKTRTACKSCRLRRCLMVGMSKSGSRYGRRSNWFKMHYLMQNNDKADDDKNNNTTSIGYDDKTSEVTSASDVIKHLPQNSKSIKPNLATSSNRIFGEPSVIESSMQQVQQNKKHLWFYVLPSEFQGKNFTNVFLDNYKNTTVQEKIKPQCDKPRAPFVKTNIPSTTISSQQILPSSICSNTPTTPRVQQLPATDFSYQSNKTPLLSLTEQNQMEEHIKSSHGMFSTSLQHLLHPIPTVHPYLYHHYSSLISLYSKQQHFWEVLWEVQNRRISQHNHSDEQKDKEPLAAVDYEPPSKVFRTKTAPGITLTHSSVSNKSLPDHNMNLISKQSNSCKTGVNDAMQDPTSLRIQNNENANNKESGCQTQDYPIDLSFRVNTAKAQQELA
ncbi:uncharacterized protein LOC135220085 [Macrobrachium nipponense]|uniref:uncharacterized protein LOC135220085 n=1 Tax=Macrobrachium nipponense TaxID=159736 RepID=UPI0030C86E1E